jgi:hypothetical protein
LVVSTLLVSLGVVVAAILVVWIAISDPDQPATIHPPVDRATRARPDPADRAVARYGAADAEQGSVATVEPDVTSPPSPAPPRPARERSRFWIWVRSALALVVLVAFAGVLLATLVGTGLALAARALRQAVG